MTAPTVDCAERLRAIDRDLRTAPFAIAAQLTAERALILAELHRRAGIAARLHAIPFHP